MKNYGVSTLFLTISLLLISFTSVLALLRGTLYHFSLSEKRIDSRIEYWQAEGGLECVYAKLQLSPELNHFDECQQGIDDIEVSGTLERTIRVKVGGVILEKSLRLPLPDQPSVIKTTSHLVITKNAQFSPDPGAHLSGDEWGCRVLQYKHYFTSALLSTRHPYQQSEPSVEGESHLGESLARCADSHHSQLATSENTQLDFEKISRLTPFNDVFGVPASQWAQIAFSHNVGRIPTDIHADQPLDKLPFNVQCGEDIARLVGQGQILIWVFGGCELTQQNINAINQALIESHRAPGLLIVIQDGILAVNSEQRLKGALMHFRSAANVELNQNDWALTSVSAHVADYQHHYRNERNEPLAIAYYQLGRFNPLGGLILDVEQSVAIIDGELNNEYQRDLIRWPLSLVRISPWLEGSAYAE